MKTVLMLFLILVVTATTYCQVDKAVGDGLTTRRQAEAAKIDQNAAIPPPDQHPTKFACGKGNKKSCINSTLMGYGSWTILDSTLYWESAGNIPFWYTSAIFSLGDDTYAVVRTQDIPGNMFSGTMPQIEAGRVISITVPVDKRLEMWFADKKGRAYSKSFQVIAVASYDDLKTPGRHSAGFAIDWSN